ncbi:MAG: MarR family winged helix-turn-helix transcriptional regulator [Kiloniellales bacterium]|nr:MarR family winged helix-turn-helix transcriptional regulator [Kiloniellales bacterium]
MQPSSIARLARELVMDPSTMARNLRPLEGLGLVEKVSREGRRSVNLSLTAEGRAMLKQGIPLWQDAQNRFVGHFGRETWEHLRGFLAQAVNATRLPDDY